MPDDSERLSRLWNWAFGNGRLGADERLRNVEATMADNNKTLKELYQAEVSRSQQEKITRRERRGFYIGVLTVLLLLGVGGIQFATYISERVNEIIEVVGPALPPF